MHSGPGLKEIDVRVGRLFMAGMPGTSLDKHTNDLIRDYCLSGVILFSRNIEDPLQVARLCRDLQKCAITYHGTPLFLAVDQEGGRVARLGKPFTFFPGNAAIGEDPQPVEKAEAFARVTAKEMSLVGLNMDFAPVVDVRKGDPEKHLSGRTFGDEPAKVALLGRTVVKVLQENGIMATAKHFPGLGRTSLDPHHHLPTIDVDAAEMKEINLPPFRAAMEEGVAAIMSSHAIYPVLDPDFPATMSHKILTDLVREELGFEGLVITDDLEMGAIKKKWGTANGAVASFKAGADILLICENQSLVLESIRTLKDKLVQGEIPFERLQQSLDRIKRVKSSFFKQRDRISMEHVRSYFGL